MTRNMRGDRASVRVARMVGSSVRRKPIPWRTAIPRSSMKARIWLMMPVRCDTSRSRTRCSACRSSCSAVLVATNFIDGLLPSDDLVRQPDPAVRADVGRSRKPACLLHSIKRGAADRDDLQDLLAAGDLPVGRLVDRRVESPLQKYFASPVGQIISTNSCHPTPPQGRIAIVTDAGRGAVDAAAFCARRDCRAGWRKACERSTASGRGMLQRTAKSCGPDAPTLASSLAELSRPNRA